MPRPGLPNLKRLEDKLFYNEDVRFSSPKTVETFLSAKIATLLSRFKNVIFRHHCIIQKSSSSIETEKN